jgi:hypothetical protein
VSAASPELEQALSILMAPAAKPARPRKVVKNCTTCAHGDFQYTDTGRLKRNTPGRCRFQPQHVLSIVMTARVERIAIWPDMGYDCPVWSVRANDPA